jgi:hypothetical protein
MSLSKVETHIAREVSILCLIVLFSDYHLFPKRERERRVLRMTIVFLYSLSLSG